MVEWNKPSEELPEHDDRPILFVARSMFGCRPTLHSGFYDQGCFNTGYLAFAEEQVSAWCYAPSIPDWCEEE